VRGWRTAFHDLVIVADCLRVVDYAAINRRTTSHRGMVHRFDAVQIDNHCEARLGSIVAAPSDTSAHSPESGFAGSGPLVRFGKPA
jgi:hypothetical protein